MASAAPAAGVPAEKCCVCLGEVSDRAVLECFHAFCRSCIIRWSHTQLEADSTSSERPAALRCPLCKAEYTRVLTDIESDSKFDVCDFSEALARVAARKGYVAERERQGGNPGASEDSPRTYEPDGTLEDRVAYYTDIAEGYCLRLPPPVHQTHVPHLRPEDLERLSPWLKTETHAASFVAANGMAPGEAMKRVFRALAWPNGEPLVERLRPVCRLDRITGALLRRVRGKLERMKQLFSAATQWQRRRDRSHIHHTASAGMPVRVQVVGRYGALAGMNGIYELQSPDASARGRPPLYIKRGRGEIKGGQEWRWMIRYYAPKSQWKIDLFYEPRETDSCFAFVVDPRAAHPADTRGTWTVWDKGEWSEDTMLWVRRADRATGSRPRQRHRQSFPRPSSRRRSRSPPPRRGHNKRRRRDRSARTRRRGSDLAGKGVGARKTALNKLEKSRAKAMQAVLNSKRRRIRPLSSESRRRRGTDVAASSSSSAHGNRPASRFS